jgi:hypothetical protein
VELKFFTSLKLYFKEKNLDLTCLLKGIRLKRLQSQSFTPHSNTSEHLSLQLLSVVFACLYLEHSSNDHLSTPFVHLMNSSTNALRMTLEIVCSVMKKSPI